MTRTLFSLLEYVPGVLAMPDQDVEVQGLALDSRQVKPGYVFIAVPGVFQDGHSFIHDAIERGAVAVVGLYPLRLPVPYVRVQNPRQAAAYLAAAFYDFPGRRLTVIGVTGTDGKTTTATLIWHILRHAGHPTGLISTIQADLGRRQLPTGLHVTTPDPITVQAYLAEMVENGLTHAVIEATSHGLDQYRVDAAYFDVAVVTNITHEHLDYHGSYTAYRAAKARLLFLLAETPPKARGNLRLSVLNQDQPDILEFLRRYAPGPVLTFGRSAQADVRAEDVHSGPGGLRFRLIGPGHRLDIESPLVGEYNVGNILAAWATTVVGLLVPAPAAQEAVARFPGLPGRMERIEMGQRFTAIVDFAHTPKALEAALQAVRPWTKGRVIAVFGSAGLRDRAKRRMMAEVSARLADITILTAEDPRTESLEAILEEMLEGALAQGAVEGETVFRVPDRGEAIRLAVRLAREGDTVLVCGKGHEQSMCFGETEYPWDDRIALRAALAEHLGLPGPRMPELPTKGQGPLVPPREDAVA